MPFDQGALIGLFNPVEVCLRQMPISRSTHLFSMLPQKLRDKVSIKLREQHAKTYWRRVP